MNSLRIGVVAWREMDRPGQLAHTPIATAIHQTPDTPKDITQRDTWGENVSPLPDGQGFKTRVKDKGERSPDEPSIVDQSSLLDHKDLGNRLTGELFVPV